MKTICPHILLKIYNTKLKQKYHYTILLILMASLYPTYSTNAQTTVVNSLEEFRIAVQNNNQEIVLEAGNYYLEDLPSNSRVINCTGSGNTIDMTGAHINTLVGSIREVYFIISGDNNVLRNGAIEDFYRNGLEEVTDFSAYNNDRDNLAYGLRGDPIMSITGNQNLVKGLEMIVKGSFPYGYGSQYGIGSQNTFGLSKRCGILITGSDGGGIGNTLDGITMYHYAFGHGIFMQSGATETTIRNCYIEGRMRLSDDMYNDTETYDLPYLTDYKFPTGDGSWRLPFEESYDIPYNHVYPLSEDGIRSYNNTGSVTVENCTVKQMRGGIRLYLASSAIVTNSQAIDCGSGGTNYNMPAGGTITGSSGNFTYAPLSDFRLSRSRQNIEMTIIPSPNAIGPHNIADILGNDHNIIFHRTPGPLDTDETRAIVVTGDNSTIVNETEYRIILESSASGNTIISCGPVTDNGANNDITYADDCNDIVQPCDSHDAFTQIEAEDFCDMLGVQITGDAVGYIQNGDWIKFEAIDFSSGATSISALVSSGNSGGTIEVRQTSVTGNLLGTLEVQNTGSWTSWETVSTNISLVTGVQDIYFVFSGGSGYLLDIDSFSFSEDTLLSVDDNKLLTPSLYPNPVANTVTIERAADSIISIYDVNGRTVFTQTIISEKEYLDLGKLTTGVYYAKVNGDNTKTVFKIVKK
ncbi:carbohydrate-binding protein [uncultured Aquimarina sp.]|uniref:carbohydrate-binding protein n=1 Tax=uncultured Aquimarina sp. TaxID=575652 RepID=UPI002634B904|nr:carbohydrate-binding protein [uncultured Aquimarina sp.]